MSYTGGFPTGELMGGPGAVFAVDGGAVGDIDLTKSAVIPAGAVILGGFIEVDVVPDPRAARRPSPSRSRVPAILAAAAISGAPWSTTGRKSVIPVFTGATTVRATAARKIQATVATAALTAGQFDVVLIYVPMPD